jgi:hypothetical protein
MGKVIALLFDFCPGCLFHEYCFFDFFTQLVEDFGHGYALMAEALALNHRIF